MVKKKQLGSKNKKDSRNRSPTKNYTETNPAISGVWKKSRFKKHRFQWGESRWIGFLGWRFLKIWGISRALGIQSPQLRMVMEPKYSAEDVIGQSQSSAENMTGCLGLVKFPRKLAGVSVSPCKNGMRRKTSLFPDLKWFLFQGSMFVLGTCLCQKCKDPANFSLKNMRFL